MSYQRATRSKGLKEFFKEEVGKKDHAKGQIAENKEEAADKLDEQYEDTNTKPVPPAKIKISFDEEETKKQAWERGVSMIASPEDCLPAVKPAIAKKKKAIAEVQKEKSSLEIPYNKKVESIMNKKPLRERLSGLLPPEFELPISFDHQQILKRMQLIDRTIEFLGTHRNLKVIYFQTLRKSIFETNSIAIDLKLLQQLLFLNENCYQIEWAFNEKIKRYDIKIGLPRVQSMDARKSELRKKIVQYLIYKEGEFLATRNVAKVENNKWHDLFDYKKVEIPQKSLPIHPNQTSSDLRAYADEQIDKISNPVLKMFFKNKKNTSEVKSLSSASVADMIFSRVPANQISNRILDLVKEKQKINNEERQKRKEEDEKVDKQAILKIYDDILLIFLSKNVGNIFKVTLLEILQQRLQFRNQLIDTYLGKLLAMEGMEFLKVVQSSKKLEVIQIDKQKYKECRALVASKF